MSKPPGPDPITVLTERIERLESDMTLIRAFFGEWLHVTSSDQAQATAERLKKWAQE